MTFAKSLPIVALAGAGALGLSAVQAQQAALSDETTAQGDVAVTIYNGSDALVQDIRTLQIPAGRSTITFPDVSARIRPETLSFSADGAGIVEQNFDFDLLTPQKMMEKAIGQEVTLLRTNPATGAQTRERAKVLSTAGGVVVQIGDRIEVLRDDRLPVRVIFDRVPPNLRARPTLSVSVESDRAGARPAAIRYLTSGLGWSADYVALFDEADGTLDMQGWVTLTNTSGTTYHDADTLLVAGSVNGNGRNTRGRPQRRGRDGFAPGTETANRERLGDFYLYPIAGRTTIANNQTKQVSFLDVQGVTAERRYVRAIGWLASDERAVNVPTSIAFNTGTAGGLGDALPAGTVRFYQRDSRGSPQFVGERAIGHTPAGSDLRLTTGDAFDVFVQAEVIEREKIDSDEYERSSRYRVIENGEVVREIESERAIEYYRTKVRYTVTNAKPQPVEVEIVQGGLGNAWWTRDYRVVAETVAGQQEGISNRRYTVTAPANGERVIEVTYETKF